MKTISKIIMTVALTLAILTWTSASEAGGGNRKYHGHPGYKGHPRVHHPHHQVRYHHHYYRPPGAYRVHEHYHYYSPPPPPCPPPRYPTRVYYGWPHFSIFYGSPDFSLGVRF